MRKSDVLWAWGSILSGRHPFLSIEITKECPLRCTGCYAYEPDHLGDAGLLVKLSDLRGEALVEGVLGLVRKLRPLHLSIVGGEPLVRYRELDILLPKLGDLDVEVQLVTSAVRPLPAAWSALGHLHLTVSVDGLQPEHDRRRSPATYDRILKHIAGHHVCVHCTITRQMLQRPGYLKDFATFWSENKETTRIWFSIYTPQEGDQNEERLTLGDRARVLAEIREFRPLFPKLDMPDSVLEGYRHPPTNPEECVFAKVTTCVSADLSTPIGPCQFGGRPVCSECGCIASAGLASFAKYKIGGLISVGDIFMASHQIGKRVSRVGQPWIREAREAREA